MCGIAGIWGNPTADRLEAMADRLRHRGPDGEGYWIDQRKHIGFAHRRLSIIDCQGGRQPISNEDGSVVTVFNGAIYNYRELRDDLIARGHRFSTKTDTEVIVHLYEDHGAEFVHKLRGMFAIALWDGHAQKLILVRDRVGKKPLYYSEANGEFLFASEVKGIVATSAAALELDQQAVADYLAWGVVPQSMTIYRQVRPVLPGELLTLQHRKITAKHRYWQLEMKPKVRISQQEAVEQIDEKLRESVRLRLRADVPVGSFLSGGIDSGLITAMAAQEYSGRLTTITIGFEDSQFDERPLARNVAQRYDTDHHEILINPCVGDDLFKIAACYDQPFADSSSVPSYYAAQAARKVGKVILNGDGGDELFAGYRRYVAGRLSGMVSWADGPVGQSLWRSLLDVLPAPRGFRTGYAFAHRFARGMAENAADRYMLWSVDMLSASRVRALCSQIKGKQNLLGSTQASSRLADSYLQQAGTDGAIDRMLGADFAGILPNDLLVKMDIACMAHGLEGRSPLLDHSLADMVAKYPETTKLSSFETKPLLRSLSRKYLPVEVQAAPKRGFEIPVVRWLRGELKPMTEDVLLCRDGLMAELFERSELERLLRSRDACEPAQWGRWVWMLLMLGIWDQQVRPRSFNKVSA